MAQFELKDLSVPKPKKKKEKRKKKKEKPLNILFLSRSTNSKRRDLEMTVKLLSSPCMACHTPGKASARTKSQCHDVKLFYRLTQDVSNLVQPCFHFFFLYIYINI